MSLLDNIELSRTERKGIQKCVIFTILVSKLPQKFKIHRHHIPSTFHGAEVSLIAVKHLRDVMEQDSVDICALHESHVKVIGTLLQDYWYGDCEIESNCKLTLIQKSWIPIISLLIHCMQYSFVFYLKVNYIDTICNMIDIVSSRSLGIIFRLNKIVACIISCILYSITAQSCHHTIFDLILFIKDGILNTFYVLLKNESDSFVGSIINLISIN